MAVQRSEDTQQVVDLAGPLIEREIAGIAAIETAIAGEEQPDYVALLHHAKESKQTNVEQLSALIRMAGATPPEAAPLKKISQQMLAKVAETFGGTAGAFRTIRDAGQKLADEYSNARQALNGMTVKAIEKTHGRTVVAVNLFTAHLVRMGADHEDVAWLHFPLSDYFAGPQAKACMRCHFDRPGTLPALERLDPHPYTYICAGCHDDVVMEFKPDLKAQMDRWSESAREARIVQQALGRPSKLIAMGTVMRRLSGLPDDMPALMPAKPLSAPLPGPAPAASARPGSVSLTETTQGERDYIAALFGVERVRNTW